MKISSLDHARAGDLVKLVTNGRPWQGELDEATNGDLMIGSSIIRWADGDHGKYGSDIVSIERALVLPAGVGSVIVDVQLVSGQFLEVAVRDVDGGWVGTHGGWFSDSEIESWSPARVVREGGEDRPE